jgi:putative peptide zinc metalloprotease protein
MDNATPLIAHPQLDLDELDADDEFGVVCNPTTHRYLRIRAREYRILQASRITSDLEALAVLAGDDAGYVSHVMGRFAESGLALPVDAAENAASAPAARRNLFVVAPAGSGVRVELVDPHRPLRHLARFTMWLTARRARAGSIALGALAIAGAVDAGDAMSRLRSAHLGATTLAVGAAILGLSLVLHEAAHGVALTRFGGRVRAMGVMVSEYAPGFYCDISDVWRLRNRHERALVAFAGIGVNLGIAGTTLALTPIVSPAVGAAFVGTAVINLLLALANAMPVLRMDGYWIAVALLDAPDLERRARRAAAAAVSSRKLDPQSWRLAAYGAALACAPVISAATMLTAAYWVLRNHGAVGMTLFAVGVTIVGASAITRIRAAVASNRIRTELT